MQNQVITNSFEVKYYSVGTREIKCSTNKKVEKMLNGASTSLPVDDLNMFTLDDAVWSSRCESH